MIKKESFFETSDGVHIYFEDYGEGKPILLVPGYLCTTKFFKKNIEELSRNNRLILIDARGHGLSSKTLKELTIPRMATDIKELVDFLGLDDLSLIGWSMGSSIVLSYYEQFGNHRLNKIGVIDSALYPFSDEPSNSHSLRGHNMEGMTEVMNFAIKDHEGYCRAFAKSVFKTTPSEEDEEWVSKEMMKTPPWIAFSIYSDFLFRDYIKVLSSLEVPLLLCCANSPAIPRGLEMANYYRKFINTKYEFYFFEKEGHVMFYENPNKFNEIVLNFVNNFS